MPKKSRDDGHMRRAIITLVTAMTLTLTGLTLAPAIKANALGLTSVTLNCNDGTGFTVSVDADGLAALTAAVQGMIDYPAGLSCTIIQNPLPTVFFSHVALAATTSGFIVDGGRWLVGCTFFGGQHTGVPNWLAARARKGPGLASRITAPLPAVSCNDPSGFCVFVNIGVNLHYSGSGTLEGTLNETIPADQTCPDESGALVAVGPSHFTSKPTPPNTTLPPGCLHVSSQQASVITYVTEISGLQSFTSPETGLPLIVGSPVRASFFDSLKSPSQQTLPQDRDMLNAPPAPDDSNCPGGFDGTQTNVQQYGNINVHPPQPQ